jgi:myotubularin-related protein 6/7/8
MVGITQNRSVQDEKLIEAVFQSHQSPDSRASAGPIYGATATNLIIDARPTANAVANTAKGAGTENMEHYKDAKKAYLGIDHIHTMRESLAKVVEALREADSMTASVRADLSQDVPGLVFLDRQALRRSGWLRHVSAILQGTVLITRNIHVNSSHVLIHCSDGWDRTAQLSSLAQLCLDPFYRTMRGFQILIEKDWLSYGHKFLDRSGHLSSEKFFVSPVETTANGGGADAAQAFLTSVQNRFGSQHHIKETSPVFHQFLESVRQIQRQFPARFQFNERFLRQLHYHLYSCQFGTFLFNCEQERRVGDGGQPPCDRTVSVWDFFNSPPELELNHNPDYDQSLDDPTSRAPKADMGVLFPNPRDVRFWNELYGRTDEDMNGRIVAFQAQDVEDPAEGADIDSLIVPPSPSPTPSPALSSGLGHKSPSIIDSSRELSVSAPSIPLRNSQDVSPQFATPSSSSSIGLSASTPSTPLASRPLLDTPRIKASDFFAGTGGVKSVWGKLSSNASAAFSVVQDVYEGVAKDLKSPTGSDRELAEKTSDSELLGRETLDVWGDQRLPMSHSHQITDSSGTLNNPWASLKGRQTDISSAPDPMENPWGSVRPISQPQRQVTLDVPFDPSASLPPDPTVAHPAYRSFEPRHSSTSVRSLEKIVNESSVEDRQSHTKEPRWKAPSAPQSETDTSGTDPLGVALL